MSAHILSTIPWRPPFLRQKKRYINTSSSNCHHDVSQEHRPSPGNILCHAGSPPCSWCLLEGCSATPSSGNLSLPRWRTHSSWLLLLLCGEFQITVTPTKLNSARASYINWIYFILIYVNDRGIVVWLPAGGKRFASSPKLQTGCKNHPVSCSLDIEVYFSGASLINLLCGAGNFGKIWSTCGQHEIQYREWRMNKYTYNYMYNFTCLFLYTCVQ